MPVCYITISEKIRELSRNDFEFIKKAIATGLDSSARKLDETHVALRIIRGTRSNMLGDIELDIFAQLYIPRLFSRDRRANRISKIISTQFDCCCATWINLGFVGYSRVDNEGDYYSDSDSRVVRIIQRLRGTYTHKRKNHQIGTS
jgi:hypothetical protein